MEVKGLSEVTSPPSSSSRVSVFHYPTWHLLGKQSWKLKLCLLLKDWGVFASPQSGLERQEPSLPLLPDLCTFLRMRLPNIAGVWGQLGRPHGDAAESEALREDQSPHMLGYRDLSFCVPTRGDWIGLSGWAVWVFSSLISDLWERAILLLPLKQWDLAEPTFWNPLCLSVYLLRNIYSVECLRHST